MEGVNFLLFHLYKILEKKAYSERVNPWPREWGARKGEGNVKGNGVTEGGYIHSPDYSHCFTGIHVQWNTRLVGLWRDKCNGRYKPEWFPRDSSEFQGKAPGLKNTTSLTLSNWHSSPLSSDLPAVPSFLPSLHISTLFFLSLCKRGFILIFAVWILFEQLAKWKFWVYRLDCNIF